MIGACGETAQWNDCARNERLQDGERDLGGTGFTMGKETWRAWGYWTGEDLDRNGVEEWRRKIKATMIDRASKQV